MFDIITPTRNAGKWLQQCITSVSAAGSVAGVTVRHLIVDDGSEDGTREVARAQGLRVVEGPGRGIYAAINRGVAVSNQEYILVLGADDLLTITGLHLAQQLLNGRREAWAVGGVQWVDEALQPIGVMYPPPPRLMTSRMYAVLGWSCLPHPATFMRRQFLSQLGGYPEYMRSAGDFHLLARAMARHKYVEIPGTVALHRRHGDNASIVAPSAVAENGMVAWDYGPRTRVGIHVRRLATRALVYSRNPMWSLRARRRDH